MSLSNRIFDTCLHGVVLLNWAWVCIIEDSPGHWWEAKGEARSFPSLARGGWNYTPKAKFSDRTPSKHVSNNIHIWILQFNCRVQLLYRFTTPIWDTEHNAKKLKKSYVYTYTMGERRHISKILDKLYEYRIFYTSLSGLLSLNLNWVCIIVPPMTA